MIATIASGSATFQWALSAVAINASLVLLLVTNRVHVLHYLQKVVSWIQGGQKARRKNVYLQGNYAPVVDELFEQDLEVLGAMPAALHGVFLRTGPNPFFTPTGDYHWFDGDGMLHACRIRPNGKVAYCNRFVQTARLQQEKNAGHALGLKMGDAHGLAAVAQFAIVRLRKRLGVFSVKDGEGTGNTAMVYHAHRLLALHEGDLPYAIRVLCEGLVETLGRVRYGGAVKHPFTAHPKVDPVTGELFWFGYRMDAKPHCIYHFCDAKGGLQSTVPIDLPQPIMMHDFAITQDYAIFLDMPLLFKPEVMVKEDSLPLRFDGTRVSRYGVLPRYAKDASALKWFELPGHMIFHVANAWQEGNIIRVFACAFEDLELDPVRADAKGIANKARLCEVVLNMKTGAASRQVMTEAFGDFPQVPHRCIGRKTRYAYVAEMASTVGPAHFVGVVKIDLEAPADTKDAVVGRLSYGEHCGGGEAQFVPAHSDPTKCNGEDDGYLVTYVHNNKTGVSELAVYNAKTMSSSPVAQVKLPQRVPYGFHSLHVSEDQVQKQLTTVPE
ncbi:hypothetical protein WJX72_001857 [[Myrmecia] bisecta]|uniref:carotenoid 9,10-dioxygenase n=1 Tax=[Myrmecia] bisecta TaxID=41462 RepID=A0AAW1PIG8_9CHLO